MTFRIPLAGTPEREACGDMATLAEQLNPANVGKLVTFREIQFEGARFCPKGAKAVFVVCLRSNDERWLVKVGPRGGWKKIWNFGRDRP